MSVKENIDAIKKEIDGEEKFLESLIKAEGFYKKYKLYLISFVVILIVGFISYQLYKYKVESDARYSSMLFTKLIETEDSNIKEELKAKNPKLHDLYELSLSIKSDSIENFNSTNLDSELLDSILKYQLASTKGDLEMIKEYNSQNRAVLQDFSHLLEGYLMIKNGDNDGARRVLEMIPTSSSIKNISDMLLHYTLKGSK